MCGLCGFYNITGEETNKISRKNLIGMRDIMVHRGPDDAGMYLSDKFDMGLAHRRLSIIDLTETGHQPMSDETKNYWIVYNGEVYNYKEIREELESIGYIFTSTSDTEVILNSFIEWGPDCLNKFNGMWAFAIWNEDKKELFVSRDRFGVKPFYYWCEKGLFIFASEIKAILKSGIVEATPDNRAIVTFIENKLVDGIENTFFDGIKRLMPAHYMIISKNGVKVKRYWNFKKKDYINKKEGEIIKEFRELFEDSVRLRLRSDVPVGTCLSGGLDSSSIFSIASIMSKNQLKTFSYFSDESSDYDERKFFNTIAEKYNADKHIVKPKGEELFKKLYEIIWHLDEPPFHPGVFPQWHVMELANPHLKVLLNGQGGDELLAGYHNYYAYYLLTLLKKSIKELSITKLLNVFRENSKIKKISGKNFLKEALNFHIKKIIDKKFKKSIIDTTFHLNNKPYEVVDKRRFNGELNNKLYKDFIICALPSYLKYEDKIGMAFSIESRLPFMDYRLFELLFSLPEFYKIHDGWTKYILRKSMGDVLPYEIAWRKDKKGFPTPAKEWFRSSELKEELEGILFDERLSKRKIFNMDILREKFNKHYSGEVDSTADIWKAINLELWFRIFIDNTNN
ncbi:asparagine synthase (glutamine-hydrolyzing) [Candidatus Altiarchaeales archaeon WOR_SM1_SCG]|nr:asparagine synthase (glutamine-hydrolyzing) [Candidatus Altiarchaeales archaeon WOR_SM1_SCG]